MSDGPKPVASSTPDRDVWRPVGQWRVDGSRIYIGDSWAVAEGLEVPITPGVYDVEARIFWYGGDERVASLRGWLRDATPDGEREVGEFAVDVASAGVMDADALDRWLQADPSAYEAWQESFRANPSDEPGFVPCEAIRGSMIVTRTGFGDGSYRVTSLLQGGRPVGFEARFLEEGQRYFDEVPIAGARERPRLALWKALAIGVLTLIGASVALVIGIVLGLFGWATLKVAGWLARLRR